MGESGMKNDAKSDVRGWVAQGGGRRGCYEGNGRWLEA